MKRKASYWLLMIAMVVVILSSQSAAYAETGAQSSSANESRSIFAEERVFRGENARQDSYFEIGKGLEARQGTSINIYYSHSETLLPEYSNLTVLLDDVPLGSVTLSKENEKETLWRIDLSNVTLKPGFHKLSFWGKMKISNVICEDPENSAAWLVIHKKSSIALQLGQSYETADLAQYPSPFIERGSPDPLRAIVVVPDKFNQDEFKAAARISRFFALQTPDHRLNIPVYVESDVTDALARSRSIIWIGKADRWLAKGKSVTEAFAKAKDGNLLATGIVGETPSPWNAENTMMLLSGTGQQLANAATILTTDTLYSQLRGAYSIIPDALTGAIASSDSIPASDNRSRALTLEQLGYGNLVTAEVLQGASSINYPIPNNWDLSNGARLHLSYKHSKSISYDKSVMTVKLNGVPVQSVKLGKATSDGGTLDIPLDPTVIGTNRTLSVEIGFQFVNGTDNTISSAASSFCSDTMLGNWAVVDKSSYLTFTPSDRLTYNLDSLPYPFVAGDEWDSTTIVMSNNGSEELSSAIALINRMDTAITDRSDFQLADIASDRLQDELKNRNVIFVGSSKELPAFLNGYDSSYVSFSTDAVRSISGKAEILAELTKKSTVLQLTSSPLNPDRSVLLLVASDRDRLPAMARIWADAEKSNQIRGRLVVVDDRGQIYSFNDTIDVRKPDAPVIVDPPAVSRPLPYSRYIFVGIFAAVIVSLAALFFMLRKRKDKLD